MSHSSPILRLGTRGSALALTQARLVRAALARAHGYEESAVALVPIKTSGDAIQDRSLAEEGGKGLFAKEIEEALRAGKIDLAVHSAKDLPALLPEGLTVKACLQREDPRDVFIGIAATTVAGLPRGARVGTTSPRRIALVKRLRPDLAIVPMRGNVETRLRKLESGEADGIILALAGLNRLGFAGRATDVMSLETFLPAAGQGAIAIETRDDDDKTNAAVARIDHAQTTLALAAERAFVAVLEGDCNSPIAAHAAIEGNALTFRGLVARPDGDVVHDIMATGVRADAEKIGGEAGRALKQRIGPDFFT
ncbi:MAG: hydroxymethylbilane synthase [Pseudolabrys sp.]|nr:hydroxymethylbilane synthase [Pseudolabrys sp.]MBV9956150.1 hydroxymethylbilane synthase [Pseudolabrys sp.]